MWKCFNFSWNMFITLNLTKAIHFNKSLITRATTTTTTRMIITTTTFLIYCYALISKFMLSMFQLQFLVQRKSNMLIFETIFEKVSQLWFMLIFETCLFSNSRLLSREYGILMVFWDFLLKCSKASLLAFQVLGNVILWIVLIFLPCPSDFWW